MISVNGSCCPFCEEGIFTHKTKDMEYTYKGHSLMIPQPGSYCNICDESILESEDMKATRMDLQAFHSRVDGLLEPKEIRRIRNVLNLNQKEAANIFGGGHNAFSRYECGELALPKAVSILLQVLDRHEDIRNEVMLDIA